VTFAAYVGVLATLALVLGLLSLTFKVLRRFTPAAGASDPRLPLAVVRRVALGPRQGIAVVRIGESLLAVSIGEGGIRPLLELSDADRDAVLAATPEAPAAGRPLPALPAFAASVPRAADFHAALRRALRFTGQTMLLAALALGSAGAAGAQGTGAAPAAGTAAQPRAAAPFDPQAAAEAAAARQRRAATGRADSMVTRLAPQIDVRVGGQQNGGLRLSGTVGVVVMMGLLTLIPTLLLMMTGFTRILIVLHFLKQALGTQSAPPGHLVAGLALLLTGFVMAPTLAEVNRTALEPWMDGRMEQAEMLKVGVQPFREFMLRQTRDGDLETFVAMSAMAPPQAREDVPLVVLVSAFVTSELRTSFQIGFALFLPFIVIDVVVSAVLMSMGMFMLPPAMIALPFKLLLFVLVDGWSLVVQGLVQSFR
jgi:flagellar biosynthetic protein FliP